jgi:hypothetical protein
MKKPPVDSKEKFLNKPMLKRLFLGALSLFIAVTATYISLTRQLTSLILEQRFCNMDVWAHFLGI